MKALAAKIIELVDIDFPVTVGVHCGPDERGLIRRDVARFLQRPHEQHTVLQYMLPWEVLIPELTPLPVIDTAEKKYLADGEKGGGGLMVHCFRVGT